MPTAPDQHNPIAIGVILVSSKGNIGESGAIKLIPVAIGALAVLVLILVLVFMLFMGSDDATSETPSTDDTSSEATSAPSNAIVEVPIEIKGALDLGSLLVDLNYDQEVLELQSVKAAALARNALVESNLETPGTVRIGLVDANGINGDGELITVFFVPIGQDESSPLTLRIVEVSDTDLRDLVVQVISSRFTGPSEPFTPPSLIFRP